MIYKKIDNFLESIIDSPFPILILGFIIALFLLPIWVISKFWNTPNK